MATILEDTATISSPAVLIEGMRNLSDHEQFTMEYRSNDRADIGSRAAAAAAATMVVHQTHCIFIPMNNH
jgi:hypothetical protein